MPEPRGARLDLRPRCAAVGRRDRGDRARAGGPGGRSSSANTDRIIDVAGAVRDAGAEAVTCINTLLGLGYDPHTLRPTLGAGGGGLSGRAIHPVAVRAVHDVHAAHPDLPIIGVGGVASAWDAVELFLAGASAVQVGTASFADPSAAGDIQRELVAWADEHAVRTGSTEIGVIVHASPSDAAVRRVARDSLIAWQHLHS